MQKWELSGREAEKGATPEGKGKLRCASWAGAGGAAGCAGRVSHPGVPLRWAVSQPAHGK